MSQMNPISNTAFYCCGVRMHDAQQVQPICGDRYASRFMDESGLRISEQFAGLINPNATNVTRHRIIDDHLREALARRGDLCVVTIGAGFDSRPYRLPGGNWVELDEPAVIAYKNAKLPVAECANPLQRVPIYFAAESLEEKLGPWANRQPVVVVIEGVFAYLDEAAIQGTLHSLRRVFPQHELICDLMTRKFFESYSRPLYEKIAGLGATCWAVDRPSEVFLNSGYRLRKTIPTVAKAVEYGAIRIPPLILKLFLRTLHRGYRVYVFDLPPRGLAS
jgi:methyltransferase (TIGR00027 family)